MPCSPKMAKCRADCLHRAHVTAYVQERQRSELIAEARSNGYGAELAEYLESHPLPTFHQYLVLTRGWSGRREHEVAA